MLTYKFGGDKFSWASYIPTCLAVKALAALSSKLLFQEYS